jgi:nicotinate-nucleotide adenylyltransferase
LAANVIIAFELIVFCCSKFKNDVVKQIIFGFYLKYMKTGLFFGSFNPIHIGHLAIANYIVEFTDVQQVWFVVSPQNPLKKKKSLLADYHRIALVREAIDGDQRFRACDVELKLPQPSYTIDTLAYLREQFPDREFSIVMGADGLLTFNKWKNYKELINTCTRYVYPRPGINVAGLPNTENCIFIDAPVIEVSSTFIRDSIKQGKNMSYFLNSKTYNYLSEMHFYEK